MVENENKKRNRNIKRNTDMANRGQQQESYLVAVFNSLINTLERNNQLIKASLDTIKNSQGGGKSSQGSSSARDSAPASASSPDTDVNRHDKVKVEIRCSFIKIDYINTVAQNFTAEVSVHAKWEEPALRGSSKQDMENFDCVGYWRPKLLVLNMSEDLEMVKWTFSVKFNLPGYSDPVVSMVWRFKGTFRESLELEHFPLDVQDLTLQVTTDRTDNEIELVDDETCLSSVNTHAFMESQEWRIYHHVESYKDVTSAEYSGTVTHPVIMVQCRVARRVGYFGWNVVFIVFLIMGLPFSSFTQPPNGSDRLAVTITLILTTIAFKLVVQQNLPTISYLTYLDIYMLVALVFLVLHAVQNSVMAYFSTTLTPEELTMYDMYSIIGLAGVMVLFHIIFFLYVYVKTSKRRRLMKRKDRRYKASRKFLEKYGRVPKPTDIVTPKNSDNIAV